jgi:hypothetical protein
VHLRWTARNAGDGLRPVTLDNDGYVVVGVDEDGVPVHRSAHRWLWRAKLAARRAQDAGHRPEIFGKGGSLVPTADGGWVRV